jgi:hypothetical protein
MMLDTRSSRSRRPELDEVRADVAPAELLDPVAEAAAQAVGMIGRLVGAEQMRQELALRGQREAQHDRC